MTTGFIQRFKGKIKVSEILLDSSATSGLFLKGPSGNYLKAPQLWSNAGAPSNGGAGTLFGFANPGDLLVDTTNLKLYQNTNTLASPTWTALANSLANQFVYNALSTAGAISLTGAQIAGGSVESILNFTGTNAANVAYTLPTVAATVTAMQAAGLNPVAGSTWKFTLINENVDNDTLTFTADAGPTWTLSGTAQTVAQGTKRSWLMKLTSLIAGTAQSLGETTLTAAP